MVFAILLQNNFQAGLYAALIDEILHGTRRKSNISSRKQTEIIALAFPPDVFISIPFDSNKHLLLFHRFLQPREESLRTGNIPGPPPPVEKELLRFAITPLFTPRYSFVL